MEFTHISEILDKIMGEIEPPESDEEDVGQRSNNLIKQ